MAIAKQNYISYKLLMVDITLYIESFAACGPQIGCVENINELQNDGLQQDEEWQPDTSFIPKRTFRRISRLSKMSLYAAHYAEKAVSQDDLGAAIFCSRYGEIDHTVKVLNAIHEKDFISPMDFSYSVHNTGQGLYSILKDDVRPATVISSRYDCIEQAMVKAYAQLKGGDKTVLIVYAEDKIPKAFHSLIGDVVTPLAFGFTVSLLPDNAHRKISVRGVKNENQIGIKMAMITITPTN